MRFILSVKLLVPSMLLAVAIGCSSTEAPVSPNPTVGTSSYTGRVDLSDFRNTMIAEKNGISITLEGTSFSTVTDSNGIWTIEKMPVGHYAIVISKTGFLTHRDSLVIETENTSYYYHATLSQIAPYVPVIDAVVMPIKKSSEFTGNDTTIAGTVFGHTFSSAENFVSLHGMLVASHASNVVIGDRNSVIYSGSGFYDFFREQDSVFNMTNSLYYSFFASNGFKPGDTIFFRMYPSISINRQFDPALDATIAQSYNEQGSNVLSAIMK